MTIKPKTIRFEFLDNSAFMRCECMAPHSVFANICPIRNAAMHNAATDRIYEDETKNENVVRFKNHLNISASLNHMHMVSQCCKNKIR